VNVGTCQAEPLYSLRSTQLDKITIRADRNAGSVGHTVGQNISTKCGSVREWGPVIPDTDGAGLVCSPCLLKVARIGIIKHGFDPRQLDDARRKVSAGQVVGSLRDIKLVRLNRSAALNKMAGGAIRPAVIESGGYQSPIVKGVLASVGEFHGSGIV